MPIYEYHCQVCSTDYEERRSFSQSDAPSQCPECNSSQVHRLLSTTFFAFSRAGDGASLSSGGGGCACSVGGGCACRGGATRI